MYSEHLLGAEVILSQNQKGFSDHRGLRFIEGILKKRNKEIDIKHVAVIEKCNKEKINHGCE